jgi:hypothetical protein
MGRDEQALSIRFRLSECNQKSSSHIHIWIIALGGFIFSNLVFLFPQISHGNINLPPHIGDGPDYDSIAVQISKGNGFSFNWDDPDFLYPYQNNNISGRYDSLLSRHGKYVTTIRPPLLPALMAASYKLFGRQFWPIRVIMSSCMSLACTIVVLILVRWFGIIPGFICLIYALFFAPQLEYYATALLTEALACLYVSLIAWFLFKIVNNGNTKSVISLGVITGLAFLTRSVFILWVVFIFVAIYIISKPKNLSWFSIQSFRLPFLFLLTFLIVSAPWMIRNCLVIKDFKPLGTMGSINLSAAYSDKAFEQRGEWFSLRSSGFFDRLDVDDESSIEWEKVRADFSTQEAIHWMSQNPLKTFLLVLFKIRGLWRPKNSGITLFYGLAILGYTNLFIIRPKDAFSFLSLLTACTISVGITWTVGGRFLVPVIPILICLASLGLWSLILSSTDMIVDRLCIE